MNTANPVELTWLLFSLVGGLVALHNFIDSYLEWRLMLAAPDHLAVLGVARSVVARANARREAVRLLIQVLFVALVIPALQREGDTPLTPSLVMVMSFPVLMAFNSYMDGRVRQNLRRLAGRL